MRYDLVNNTRRQKLIQLVYGENPITTKQACLKLGINLSTAKYILKIYRRQGRFQRQTRRHNSNPPKPNSTTTQNHEQAGQWVDQIQESKQEENKNFNDPQDLPGIPQEIKDLGTPSEIEIQDYTTLKRLTQDQLQNLLDEVNQKCASQTKQLKIVEESYNLINKLLASLEIRESQIRKSKQELEQHIIPSILLELRGRKTYDAVRGIDPFTKELFLALAKQRSQVDSLIQGVGSMIPPAVEGSPQQPPTYLSENNGGSGFPFNQ